MCEFCLKHGEGQKWYLNARNYSEDMLSDLKRQKLIKGFLGGMDRSSDKMKKQMADLDKAPSLVKRMIRWKTVRTQKKVHYGQVVPLEDVERIMEFVNSIVRVACICRHVLHKEEKRYCYGISMGPGGGKFLDLYSELDMSFFGGPGSMGVETISKEDALANFKTYEKEGLCHSVWTFLTPFIGGICNCDRPDCLAMQMSVTHGIPIMFRAEYVAEHDEELCEGCRRCMKVCQFGAIGYSAGRKKSYIDPRRCYGCGICRAVCKKDAISLSDRTDVPVAASMWH